MHLIILAGGKNSRIQTKKALLAVGGVPIIERIIGQLAPVVQGSLIVTGDPEVYAFTGVPTTPDRYHGKGPLGGLHAGLAASPEDLNLVVACDMPFVSAELAVCLRAEAQKRSECDAIIPAWRRGREPLFAVYRRRAAALLAERLETGDYCLKNLDRAVTVGEVDVTGWAARHGVDLERAFCNINTWSEWQEAENVCGFYKKGAEACVGPSVCL